MNKVWQTRLTQQFPPTIPIIGAPMAGVSGAHLAFATTKTGALGSIAAGHYVTDNSAHNLDLEVQEYYRLFDHNGHKTTSATTEATQPPLMVGFICHSTFNSEEGWNRVENFMKRYKPQVVQYFSPALVAKKQTTPLTTTTTTTTVDDASFNNNIELAHKYGCKVMAQVGTEEEARKVLDAGTDCIIAQGTEAGGHGCRYDVGSGTLALASRIVTLVRGNTEGKKKNIPVLAAGGIVNGRGLAAALALGCDGIVLGTRLWASSEAKGAEWKKQKLADANVGPDQVIRTTVMDKVQNSFSKTPWPEPFDSSGVLRNEMTDMWHGREKELDQALQCKTRKRNKTGVEEKGDEDNDEKEEENEVVVQFKNESFIYAGKGVGDISSITSAHDIIQQIEKEAFDIIQSLPQMVLVDKGDNS
uniref:Nitronate monooxygenase domain-containing protein n=2 Tax=Ditylum brightwellii TaxID=49249 RepID=A0A7S4RKX3_9STRA